MKWVMERLSLQWQQQWYEHCWLRMLKRGYCCRFCVGILLQSGWILYGTTFPEKSVKNQNGIHSREIIKCPAASQRSRILLCRGIQHVQLLLNQLWWWQYWEVQRRSTVLSTIWHMEWISTSLTSLMRKMWISPMRIRKPVFRSPNTDAISTLLHFIP